MQRIIRSYVLGILRWPSFRKVAEKFLVAQSPIRLVASKNGHNCEKKNLSYENERTLLRNLWMLIFQIFELQLMVITLLRPDFDMNNYLFLERFVLIWMSDFFIPLRMVISIKLNYFSLTLICYKCVPESIF